MSSPLTFKMASEDWEFEQIHQLNYKTFVEEIPQHRASPEKRLIDKFHSENTYFICVRDHQVLGMLACRANRPFSLDSKLADLDTHLPPHHSLCEIRLLSVEKNVRGGKILPGLMRLLFDYCKEQGYDLALISGTVRQLKLYQHLGFIPFGPLVGEPGALYQPMYLTWESFSKKAVGFAHLMKSSRGDDPVNFLPGPVSIHPSVRDAFIHSPISHRSKAFLEVFAETKRLLTQLTYAENVEILLGTGTLANDVIAAHLGLVKGRGLILSNGEFGERLLNHAHRAGLKYIEHRISWGMPFSYEDIERQLAQNPDIRWLWAVHLETSTGVLNDLSRLKTICKEHQLYLCLDCISSIGSLPIDLDGVYLASGVSGKALASYPGLCLVFTNSLQTPEASLPRYLDLNLYHAAHGVPFTHSSNLIYALRQALLRIFNKDLHVNARYTGQLREKLKRFNDADLTLVAPDSCSAPNVITIALPDSLNSQAVGQYLEDKGFLLSYLSSYLIARNWIQVCLMGEYDEETIEGFIVVFKSLLNGTLSRGD